MPGEVYFKYLGSRGGKGTLHMLGEGKNSFSNDASCSYKFTQTDGQHVVQSLGKERIKQVTEGLSFNGWWRLALRRSLRVCLQGKNNKKKEAKK